MPAMQNPIGKDEVARRLRLLAAERNMTAAEIAERAGLRPHAVQQYLSGEVEPAASRFLRVLDAMACSLRKFEEMPSSTGNPMP